MIACNLSPYQTPAIAECGLSGRLTVNDSSGCPADPGARHDSSLIYLFRLRISVPQDVDRVPAPSSERVNFSDAS